MKLDTPAVSRPSSLAALAGALACLFMAQRTSAALIDFDQDAAGNAMTVPSLFTNVVRLTELYAPLGVHFVGPGGNDGGAILDQDGGFGLNALSGRNFLAFNRIAPMADNGLARDPETILFDTPMLSVSIFAAGGSSQNTFTMEAYDSTGILLASDTVTSLMFSQMTVASSVGITRVVLREVVNSGDQAFVYDDLSFTPVPEPGTCLLVALGLGALFTTRIMKRR